MLCCCFRSFYLKISRWVPLKWSAKHLCGVDIVRYLFSFLMLMRMRQLVIDQPEKYQHNSFVFFPLQGK